MGRPCWICGCPDSTREHVWPDWMKQIANGSAGNYQVGIGDDPTEWREWKGTAFELTSRVLCGPCNGRLGQLEGQVSPLIRSLVGGTEQRLYGDEQAVLAQWLYKTGLMVATTNRRDETTLPRSHYTDLATSFDFPPASMAWIGRVMTPLHDAALWVQRFVWHDSLRVNPPRADGYSFVLTVKRSARASRCT